jgi:hypothetical protein
MDSNDIAYLAGFFDGEGCIQINKSLRKDRINSRYWVTISAVQVFPTPLLKLQKLFGGQINVRSDIASHRNLGCWRIQGTKAKIFLETMIPFLDVKREEAELALEFANILSRDRGYRKTPLTLEEITQRDDLKQRVHSIKKRNYQWTTE